MGPGNTIVPHAFAGYAERGQQILVYYCYHVPSTGLYSAKWSLWHGHTGLCRPSSLRYFGVSTYENSSICFQAVLSIELPNRRIVKTFYFCTCGIYRETDWNLLWAGELPLAAEKSSPLIDSCPLDYIHLARGRYCMDQPQMESLHHDCGPTSLLSTTSSTRRDLSARVTVKLWLTICCFDWRRGNG